MNGNQVDQTKSADQDGNGTMQDDRKTTLRTMLLERRQVLTREIDELIARHRSDQTLQREQSVADTGRIPG
ncbi:MAG: hypothetical protein H0X01_02010 [Nitrospira sp.]|nr:hypothetical protein [Nitrospira sp.]